MYHPQREASYLRKDPSRGVMKKAFCRSERIKDISRDGSFPFLEEKKKSSIMKSLKRLKCQKVKTEHSGRSSYISRDSSSGSSPHFEWSLEETGLKFSDIAPTLPPIAQATSSASSEYILMLESDSSGLPGTFDVDSQEEDDGERIGIRPFPSLQDASNSIISVDSNDDPFVDNSGSSVEEIMAFKKGFNPFGLSTDEDFLFPMNDKIDIDLSVQPDCDDGSVDTEDSDAIVYIDGISSTKSAEEQVRPSLNPPSMVASESEESESNDEPISRSSTSTSEDRASLGKDSTLKREVDLETRDEPERPYTIDVKDYLSVRPLMKEIDEIKPAPREFGARSTTSTKMQSLISIFESKQGNNNMVDTSASTNEKRVVWSPQRETHMKYDVCETSSTISRSSKSSTPSFFWRSHPGLQSEELVASVKDSMKMPPPVLRPSRYGGKGAR